MQLLLFVAVVFNFIIAAVSQTGPQASKIPVCVLPCDTKAIATTTCTSTDIPCHCQQKDMILSSIIPCVLYGSNCTDPVQDLYTFESFFGIVCAPYNTSIPQNATSVALSGIGSPSSTSPVYSNGAGRIPLWFGIF